MSLRSLRNPAEHSRDGILETERTLIEHYGDLVRLAHVVLPVSLGRHRRVLVAHSVVQRALRAARPARVTPAVPPPRLENQERAALERSYLVTVVQDALAHGRRPAGWPARLAPPRALLPRLPLVLGLRLFPRSGSVDELAFTQALAELSAPARAAFVLRLHGMPDDATADVLAEAGVDDTATALREARVVAAQALPGPSVLQEFDACALQASPTDLLRRRRRTRAGGVAVLALLAAVAAVTAMMSTPQEDSSRPLLPSGTTDPVLRATDLSRVPAGLWDNTSRVDFTAWPARGSRIQDQDLLDRALNTWARPPHGTHVTASRATSTVPPTAAPQLLYAGNVQRQAVVLFYDGQRLARYSEPVSSGRTPGVPRSLTVARVDDADVTTSAAVALTFDRTGVRYLIAPWIAQTQTRDLLRPDTLARPLDVSGEGVTRTVPVLPRAGGCDSGPVLQLRSSERIAEHHAFLLAGVGDLTPVHLTYTPLPGHGSPPARQPREATGPAALLAWSRHACALGELRDTGVRAVNAWDFAEQDLPDGGGHAVWTCARTSSWRGPGEAVVTLRTSGDEPDEAARVVSRERSSAVCTRFGQHVAAATGWRSPKGKWYVLAAGSRAVTALTLDGAVSAHRQGRTLFVPAPPHPNVTLRADLSTGGQLRGLVPVARR
ncbi:hypothetical protein OHT57_46570 [Streptomyces sp. NBC_00285]|uniref:hypothetical protein n=1 Tax=Streptomyces sp. NBC_00285 TaxID=2975700 RepID=UPI002E2E4A33|nr:hypothetical protein [Streptomyces sp. NBC_00285]